MFKFISSDTPLCTPPGGVVTHSVQESKEMNLVVEEFILLIF